LIKNYLPELEDRRALICSVTIYVAIDKKVSKPILEEVSELKRDLIFGKYTLEFM
jgi:hypothetical protein